MKRSIGKRSKLLIDGERFEVLCAYIERRNCDHISYCHTVEWLLAHGVENIHVHLERFTDLLCVCDCDLPFYIQDGPTWSEQSAQPLAGSRVHGRIKWARTIKALVRDATRRGGEEDDAA